jgi:iron complex outermembrane receptor protein
MLNRKFLLGTTVIAGLAMAMTTPAFAQTPAPAPAQQPAEEEDEAEVEALIVTGSRIKRTEFTSASPIQVITTENADLQGIADTAEMLQSSTLAAGSPQINATISSAFVTNGGPGAATISLRGLGANRTLVLLNGRRAGPAGTRGGVSSFDLNVLPQSSIERIEILKDGASSIYGSDAIAGVVNIITRSNRDGWDFEAFASQPEEQGGEQYRFNGGWGKTFDRGYISVSADYYLQAEQTVGDRDYTNCTRQYITNTATRSRIDTVDPRTGQAACQEVLWGHLWLYDYSGSPLPVGAKLQYDYDGNLATYIPRVPAGYPTVPNGDAMIAPAQWFFVNYGPVGSATQGVTNYNHPFVQASSLIPEVERMTVFVNGGFDVTPSIEAYGEFLLNRRTSKTNGYRQFWNYMYTSDWFGAGDPLNAGFHGNFWLSPTAITDHNSTEQTVDYARAVIGLRGDFGSFLSGWDWDVFAQLSRSDGDYTTDVILKDTMEAANFRTGSCVGTTTPVSGKACLDMPWLTGDFMAGKLTQAEQDFLFDTDTGNTIYTQQTVEGSVAGNLFSLPAGPIGAAFGFHFRTDEIEDVPGPITLVGNSWGLSRAGITAGDDTTKEVFGELQVPVAKGLPGMEELSLTLSGRWTEVESYGEGNTYKVGVNWQITPAWRIRASKGTSFRAPALFELYLANQTSSVAQRLVDPCIRWAAGLAALTTSQRVANNCANPAGPGGGVPGAHTGSGSSATLIQGGGFGQLEAETSEALSVGVIWAPDFIDLNVAVDYFEIEVNDQVTSLSGGQILSACYRSATFPVDPICSLFDRNPGHKRIDQIRAKFINIASQSNRGVDLTVRYQHEFDFGRFVMDSQFTWQLEDDIALFAGSTVDSNGDVGDPDFVGNTNFRFERGDWTFNWFVELIGKASDSEDFPDRDLSGTIGYKMDTEFTAYHSASVRRRMDTWTFTGGVANLFGEAPPSVTPSQVQSQGTSVLSSQYDYYGRRVFLNVRKAF